MRKHLDKMQESNPDLTYRFLREQKHVHLHVDNVRKIIDTMKHARTFITSREKMHPTGVGLYDELLDKLQKEIKGFGF